MRERVSGAMILVALAVIFVPMLFDEPAPRDERPRPVMTIERPAEVERQDVPAPEPPDSLRGGTQAIDETPLEGVEAPDSAPSTTASATTVDNIEAMPGAVQQETPGEDAKADDATKAEDATEEDPIAALARAADERLAAEETAPTESPRQAAEGGEWAVQVGSFGEPGNAERLQARLESQGFPAYRRPRDNDLTSVYVGPYDSSEVAEVVMAELKAKINLQGLLVRTER
ncbi:DedD protein [Halomonas cerina]|uniref:DedD protein n=2 Tax=Halomonas cerina TaxID=447424 RepID=A0A839V5J2_9GAMM|nr:DedD protein [Halomonas cerina]